jgi:hypothetical protein
VRKLEAAKDEEAEARAMYTDLPRRMELNLHSLSQTPFWSSEKFAF